jgi:hypothetical protein
MSTDCDNKKSLTHAAMLCYFLRGSNDLSMKAEMPLWLDLLVKKPKREKYRLVGENTSMKGDFCST